MLNGIYFGMMEISKMELDKELIIENTLNFGIDNSAKRFNLTKEEVEFIVKPFCDEIDDVVIGKCSCLSGNGWIMCIVPCQQQIKRRFIS